MVNYYHWLNVAKQRVSGCYSVHSSGQVIQWCGTGDKMGRDIFLRNKELKFVLQELFRNNDEMR